VSQLHNHLVRARRAATAAPRGGAWLREGPDACAASQVRSAIEPRGTQVDAPMLDMLLGCAFLPVPPAEAEEAEAALRPHLAPPPQSSS